MPRGDPRLRTVDQRKNLVGVRVRTRREALKLTRDVLTARIAAVTEGLWNPALQEVLHIEQGTRTVTDLEVLALGLALEIDACWLLTGGGEPTPFLRT